MEKRDGTSNMNSGRGCLRIHNFVDVSEHRRGNNFSMRMRIVPLRPKGNLSAEMKLMGPARHKMQH